MDRDQFRSQLHVALSNIHDYAILEKLSLNDLIPRPDLSVLRAENLKRFIWNGIESLKPSTQHPQLDSLEWRYYLILSGRYIEGVAVTEIQQRLALGERQERRLHGKACRALEEILYDRLFPVDEINKSLQRDRSIQPVEGTKPEIAEESPEKDFSFMVSLEPLHLDMVINETASLILPQLQAHGGDLSIQVPSNLAMVQADRIILRQILLYLFNCILQNWACNDVKILGYPNTNKVFLEISSWVKSSFVNSKGELRSNKLLTYWLEKLGAQLQVDLLAESETNFSDPELSFQIRYALELPVANQEKILVVDDHEPAIRIIQRYLSQTNIQVVGVSDPIEIISIARTLHPKAVLLDVMMPAVDGWEILQKLKSDPDTLQIPVIIYSVWEQPDLAFSLGANGFLKKPISQAELMNELVHLNLLDISDEPPPRELLRTAESSFLLNGRRIWMRSASNSFPGKTRGHS